MKKDYDELETYNHNNDSYNEYGGQARMTYDDLNRVVSAKVCGSMLWMVLGLLVTGITGYMVYTGLVSGNPVAYGILKMYWLFAILEIAVVFGFTALVYKSCEIAYTQCEEWLKECLEVIYKNQQLIVEFFEKNYPEIKVIRNEGTYLLWVDFRALNMEPEDLEKFMINEASIFLDEGYIFGENGKGFERFNLAVPTSVIEETLQRLDKALKKLKNN